MHMSNEVTFQKPPKKRDPMYITIIVLLLAVGGLCAYQWMHYKSEAEKYQAKAESLNDDLKNLESILGSSGISLQSTDLEDNLNQMLHEYDSLMLQSDEMTDSLVAQRDRVQGLLVDLEQSRKNNSLNRRKILALTKETETLRTELKRNYRRIDSLRQVTLVQAGTIEDQRVKIDDQTTQITDLSNQRDDLDAKVKAGSKIQITPPVATTLREKSGGSFRETQRAKNTNMIKAFMTILSNRIAESGPRTLYMIIIDPNGKVLTDGDNYSFDAGGQSMTASIKRRIDYNRDENLDLSIYYTVPDSQKLEKGEYTVQIYSQGLKLGSTKFALK